jgi:hypothetical protein
MRKLPIGILAVIACLLLTTVAHGTNIDLGVLTNYTVVGQSSVIINSCTSFTGNVAIGGGTGTLAKCKPDGTVYIATGASPSISTKDFVPTGGFTYGQDLSAVFAAMDAKSAYYGGLAPTQTFTSLNSTRTLTGNGGMNVINVGSVALNGMTLTLSGSANDVFIINVSGTFNFSQSTMVLNGVNASNILFNLVGSPGGTDVLNKSTSTFYGFVLGPDRNITIHNPFPFDGRVYANTINIHSDAIITSLDPPAPVPEPAAFVLLGSGLLAVGGFLRRRLF